MSPVLEPPYHFIFANCQVGAEGALKEEVSDRYPELRFAFSRPGFVTFKSEKPIKLEKSALELVFGRRTGLSLGRLTLDREDALAAIRDLQPRLGATLIQVWERDQHKPGETPRDFDAQAWTRDARAKLAAAKIRIEDRLPEPGEKVLDVVVIDPGEWWVGAHRHASGGDPMCGHPGANPPIAMHPQAPSRAYVKLREGVLWSGAKLGKGESALEIGSAPGGAAYALLEMGLRVAGIDPGAMDARVMSNPDFTHLQMPVSQVTREDLDDTFPEGIDWLLLDMNVTPQVSLAAVEGLLELMEEPARGRLKGLLLTIKLNNWRIAREIPLMLEKLEDLGMKVARATQLSHNRQEIFVFAAPTKESE